MGADPRSYDDHLRAVEEGIGEMAANCEYEFNVRRDATTLRRRDPVQRSPWNWSRRSSNCRLTR